MPMSELFFNRTAVQHDLVTDGYVVADRQRKTGVSVQNAAILNIAALTHLNPFIVAAQYGIEPNTAVRF